MTRKYVFAVAAALLTLNLAACSGAPDDPMPADNSAEMETPSAEDSATPTPEPATPQPEPTEAANASVADDTPAPPPPAPDAQMMDDASATGMTSRAARNDPSAEDTPAAEPTEKK
ncbi:hypothetical protein [Sphingomonas sp. CARO-RG-8B-R24-01]|uniref:hypothetical protein n=1 Tax=Sphingomonas sp. CARO-RG-8B-R24-01 TaxID=2914831 RepID=UPI001F57655D|nr:hypothetical protein [Sphingomonas sp. CARO-RG-8B-R24-01]